MTDHFSKEMEQIAIRSAKNGGPTIADVLKAMVAGNLDAEESNSFLHKEIKTLGVDLRKEVLDLDKKRIENAEKRHKEILDTFKEHCVEADFRDTEINELQEWRRVSSESCQRRIEEIVKAELHAAHLAESHNGTPQSGMSPLGRDYTDPADSQFTEHRQSAFSNQEKDDRSFREMMLAWSATKKVLAVIVSAIILILVGITVSYVGHRLGAEHEVAPQPAVTVTASPSPTTFILP